MLTKKQIGAILIFIGVPLIIAFLPKSPEEPFEDGVYCADVEYYNPNTDEKSAYTLPVEVKDFRLIKIYWKNGGWLDESHFEPEDISEGTAEISSDKGYEYRIKLNYYGRCD